MEPGALHRTSTKSYCRLRIQFVVFFPNSELSFIRDFIVNVFAGAKPPIYTRFAAVVARSRWFAGLHLCQRTYSLCAVP
jgi:hypothetical protein